MIRRYVFVVMLMAALGIAPSSVAALPNSLIKEFGNQLSAKICQDGGAWLTCYRLSPDRCGSIIGEIVSACATQALGSVAGVMSYQEALVKARSIDGCVNEKFLAAYGFQKDTSAACAKPASHLQGE